MNKPFLSVVIPAYNEEKRLPLTLVDIDKNLRNAPFEYEIIVADDGSRDATCEIVGKMEATIKNLRLIANSENKGKGSVVKQGMLAAAGEYRLFMDADNSTSVKFFLDMIPAFKSGYDVVIGSREAKGSRLEPPQPWYRRILGRGSNLIIQAVNLPGIWDTQCGFKAFSESAAQRIFSLAKITGWGFDIEILALARSMGYKIKEIPIVWVNDSASRVKMSAYLKVFIENLKIRWWLITGGYRPVPKKTA
jgi:dolichyl-phosphate beta-glucosyltransferase